MDENNFYSIDKLVDFGLSMAVAQQMVQTMNYTINSMNIPNSVNLQNVVSLNYYVVIDAKTAGPFTNAELMQLINQKKLTKDSFVWRQGMPNWEKVEKVPEVLKLVALCPPPLPNEVN